jgi:hypothetical protein
VINRLIQPRLDDHWPGCTDYENRSRSWQGSCLGINRPEIVRLKASVEEKLRRRAGKRPARYLMPASLIAASSFAAAQASRSNIGIFINQKDD